MTERLKFMGHLEEKRLEAERLKLRLQGMRDSIRNLLYPFDPLESLEADTAAALAVEFASLMIHYKEVLAEMQAIRKALGR